MTQPPASIIAAVRASTAGTPIPVSFTLAQWANESAWGKSVSGKNNYGGYTAKVKDAKFPFVPGTPLEPATLCWTHEELPDKRRVRVQRWFKDFPTAQAYFDAHNRLLATSPIYAAARAKLPNLEAFARAVGAHYATDDHYADSLLAIIRGSNLTQYDRTPA